LGRISPSEQYPEWRGRSRVMAGLARARARSVKLGRPRRTRGAADVDAMPGVNRKYEMLALLTGPGTLWRRRGRNVHKSLRVHTC
jgi:hypothetical protein